MSDSPSGACTILFGVHEKGRNIKTEGIGAWRGVLARHWNNIDLSTYYSDPKRHTTTIAKPPPNYQSYVFDPNFGSKDINIHEIEGRQLEIYYASSSAKNFKGWKSYDNQPAQRTAEKGIKMTIMIDDKARHGTYPDYQKNLSFLVGFGAWNSVPGQFSDKNGQAMATDKSPSLMSAIWRDSLNPSWETWSEPGSSKPCNLMPMYFITEKPYPNICQKRPDYKHPAPPQEQKLITPGGQTAFNKIRLGADGQPVLDANGQPIDDETPADNIVPEETLDQDDFGGATVDDLVSTFNDFKEDEILNAKVGVDDLDIVL